MPRQARQRSSTGIYHIMLRGVNRQRIFDSASDYQYFVGALRVVQQDSGIAIFAYCLMPNHVHLLIQEGWEPVSSTMKRLGVRYAGWFNRKYDRVGHLFQDRFASRPVEDDGYLLMALRYIHFNPVAAGLCDAPELYPWSSRPTLGQPNSIVSLERLEQLVPLSSVLDNEDKYELKLR